MSYEVENISKNKRPYSDDNFVGIEIECIVDLTWTDENLTDVFIKHGLQYNTTLTEDGSIKTKYRKIKYPFSNYTYKERTERPLEIKLLIRQSELFRTLMKLNKVFDTIKPKVNNSCGLHVHLDARNRNVIEMVKSLIKARPELWKKVSPERIKNRYCRPVQLKHALRSIVNSSDGSRYKDINTCSYGKYGTVEVRLHEGTVDVTKIYGWVKYLISLVDIKQHIKKEAV